MALTSAEDEKTRFLVQENPSSVSGQVLNHADRMVLNSVTGQLQDVQRNRTHPLLPGLECMTLLVFRFL